MFIKSKRNRIFRALLALGLVLTLSIGALPFMVRTKADVVTDTLTIRVGYLGMNMDEYVTVSSFHWQELYENLALYSYAYSYYKGGSGNKFTAIIDSANGFLVTDILDYAHIYQGDVYNLKFYVEDHHGIQAAFDSDSLFAARYYFRDFNYNARYYDEDGKEYIDPDRCWSDCEEVPPMLALEDNWASFTEEFEHADPDFENMHPGNRFRLLFGQTNPTEQATDKSAKYVSCVYVTLYGSPEYGDTPELDNSYGAHQVEFDIRAGNESVRDALSELLNMNSTNEEVLIIKGYTITPDEFYSDIAHVTVDYEIVGKGDASIAGNIGGLEMETPVGEQKLNVTVTEDDPAKESESETEAVGEEESGDPEESQSPEESSAAAEGGNEEESSQQEESTVSEEGNVGEETEKQDSSETESKEEEKPAASESDEESTKASEEEKPKESSEEKPVQESSKVQEETKPSVSETAKKEPEKESIKETAKEKKTEEKTDELKAKDAEVISENPAFAASGILMYEISESLAKELSSGMNSVDGALVQESIAANQKVTQVKVEDKTKEKEDEARRLLLFTGLACILIGSAGMLYGNLSFKWKMKGK